MPSVGSLALFLTADSGGATRAIDGLIDDIKGLSPALGSVLGAARTTQKGGGGVSQMLESASYAAKASGSDFLGDVAAPVLTGLSGLTGVIGELVSGIPAAIGMFKSLGDSIAGFVKVADPYTADRWEMAWEDLYAVIGQKLSPVLDGLTAGVRVLADTVKSVLPDLGPLGEGIKGLFDGNKQYALEGKHAYDLRQQTAKEKGVQTKDVDRQGIFEGLDAYAERLKGKDWAAGSSVGAAYRAPSFSSIDQIGRQSALNAFGSSLAEGKSEQERIAENTGGLLRLAEEFIQSQNAGARTDAGASETLRSQGY